MTWSSIWALAPLCATIAVIVLVVAIVRARAYPGLTAVVNSTTSAVNAVIGGLGRWFRQRAHDLRAMASRELGVAVGPAVHRTATAATLLVLATVWLVATGLYVGRNVRVLLTGHNDAVRAGAAQPDDYLLVVATAEALSPVLLTALCGMIMFELLGFSHHIPFLHRPTRLQKLLLAAAASAVLTVAMLMQYSVARQEMANGRNETIATIEERRFSEIPPLPLGPTAAETSAHVSQVAEFDARVARPMMASYTATIGPGGWRTWMPIGAALIDFLCAFALVPALLLLWSLFLQVLRSVMALLGGVFQGAASVASTVGAGILLIANQPAGPTASVSSTTTGAAWAPPGASVGSPLPPPLATTPTAQPPTVGGSTSAPLPTPLPAPLAAPQQSAGFLLPPRPQVAHFMMRP